MRVPVDIAIGPGVVTRKRRDAGVIASRLCAPSKNAKTSWRGLGTSWARSRTWRRGGMEGVPYRGGLSLASPRRGRYDPERRRDGGPRHRLHGPPAAEPARARELGALEPGREPRGGGGPRRGRRRPAVALRGAA